MIKTIIHANNKRNMKNTVYMLNLVGLYILCSSWPTCFTCKDFNVGFIPSLPIVVVVVETVGDVTEQL